VPSPDISLAIFKLLRATFFDKNLRPVPFSLRPKAYVQSDPLDEYIFELLKSNLPYQCSKGSPLVSPDMVIYEKNISLKDNLNISKILGIEVKKLMRTNRMIARQSGLDYNSTPPCGKIRVYLQNNSAIDIRSFYIFVCQEQIEDRYILSSLVICDGNSINMDFDLYLKAVETRGKLIDLGTYADGMNRVRPMFVFPNPLGLNELDHAVSLIHENENLDQIDPDLKKIYKLNRNTQGKTNQFSIYRLKDDVSPDTFIEEINGYKVPYNRRTETQSRGKFKLPFLL